MVSHEVVTTDAQIDTALEKAKRLEEEVRVTSVKYKDGPELNLIILKLSDGHRALIAREDIQELRKATPRQIRRVEILGNGTALRWPDLDLDLYVPSLLKGIYGTRLWMAQLGRRGGIAKSFKKQQASRLNGRKGGRPKLTEAFA